MATNEKEYLLVLLFNCAPGMARSALTGAIPEGGASQDDLGVKVPYGP